MLWLDTEGVHDVTINYAGLVWTLRQCWLLRSSVKDWSEHWDSVGYWDQAWRFGLNTETVLATEIKQEGLVSTLSVGYWDQALRIGLNAETELAKEIKQEELV